MLSNTVVNHAGITSLFRLGEETGASAARLTRAHLVARELFGVAPVWDAVAALANQVPGSVRMPVLLAARRLVERAARRLLHQETAIDLTTTPAGFGPAIVAVLTALPELLVGAAAVQRAETIASLVDAGVPKALVEQAGGFEQALDALDIVEVAEATHETPLEVGAAHYELADRLRLEWLRAASCACPSRTGGRPRRAPRYATISTTTTAWSTRAALTAANDVAVPDRVGGWLETHDADVARFLSVLGEVEASGVHDLAALAVLVRELRDLASSGAF